MVPYLILAAVLLVTVARVWRRRRHAALSPASLAAPAGAVQSRFAMSLPAFLQGDIALVAAREIRERTRGRVFRVGTIIILLAVAAGIVIPTLHHSSSGSDREHVAIVGVVSAPLRTSIIALGPALGATVAVTTAPDLTAARHDLAAGHIDIVLNGTTGILLNTTPNANDSSTTTQLAQAMALTVSLQTSLQANGLTAQKATTLTHPTPLPITGLRPRTKSRPATPSPSTG